MFLADGDIVYAFEPINNNSSILWRSDNRGTDWTQAATNPFGTSGSGINDVDMDAQDPDRLYVARPSALWVFDGASWTETAASGGVATEVFGTRNSTSIKSLTTDPNIPGTVYAGMWAGGLGQRNEFIYRATDFEMTWQDLRLNLDGMQAVVWGLAIDPATSEVHMSTSHGNFVLRSAGILGDLNCDGAFNGGDIDPFFLALGDPVAYATQFPNCHPLLGDINGDGRLDGGDIDPCFACLGGVCP